MLALVLTWEHRGLMKWPRRQLPRVLGRGGLAQVARRLQQRRRQSRQRLRCLWVVQVQVQVQVQAVALGQPVVAQGGS
jgi:hypothetical protein